MVSLSGRQSRQHPTHSLTFHSVVTQSVPLPNILVKTTAISESRTGGLGHGLTNKKQVHLQKPLLDNHVQETTLT